MRDGAGPFGPFGAKGKEAPGRRGQATMEPFAVLFALFPQQLPVCGGFCCYTGCYTLPVSLLLRITR